MKTLHLQIALLITIIQKQIHTKTLAHKQIQNKTNTIIQKQIHKITLVHKQTQKQIHKIT